MKYFYVIAFIGLLVARAPAAEPDTPMSFVEFVAKCEGPNGHTKECPDSILKTISFSDRLRAQLSSPQMVRVFRWVLYCRVIAANYCEVNKKPMFCEEGVDYIHNGQHEICDINNQVGPTDSYCKNLAADFCKKQGEPNT